MKKLLNKLEFVPLYLFIFLVPLIGLSTIKVIGLIGKLLISFVVWKTPDYFHNFVFMSGMAFRGCLVVGLIFLVSFLCMNVTTSGSFDNKRK